MIWYVTMSLAKLPFKMLSDTIFAHCLGQVSNPEVSSLAYHFAAWCASLGPLRRPLFWSRRESNHSLTHCGLIGNILDYFNIYAQHCAQLSIDWRHLTAVDTPHTYRRCCSLFRWFSPRTLTRLLDHTQSIKGTVAHLSKTKSLFSFYFLHFSHTIPFNN